MMKIYFVVKRINLNNPYDNKVIGGIRSEKCTEAGSIRTDRESAPSS